MVSLISYVNLAVVVENELLCSMQPVRLSHCMTTPHVREIIKSLSLVWSIGVRVWASRENVGSSPK